MSFTGGAIWHRSSRDLAFEVSRLRASPSGARSPGRSAATVRLRDTFPGESVHHHIHPSIVHTNRAPGRSRFAWFAAGDYVVVAWRQNCSHAIRRARRRAGLQHQRSAAPAPEHSCGTEPRNNCSATQCGGGPELGCPFVALTVRSGNLTAPLAGPTWRHHHRSVCMPPDGSNACGGQGEGT